MRVMRAIGLGLGLLGLVIGGYSAWFELTKGAESPTSGYVALGVAAFVLAIGAGVAPLVLRRRPTQAGVVMGTLGHSATSPARWIPPAQRILSFLAAEYWVVAYCCWRADERYVLPNSTPDQIAIFALTPALTPVPANADEL
jgi:hypothetical protein